MTNSARYHARLGAVQYLYALAASQNSDQSSSEHILVDSKVLLEGDLVHFRKLLVEIPENFTRIDRILESALDRRIERVDQVELAILRLGVFEMVLLAQVPKKVVLNECIELAKELGDKNSYKFVNGVLDKISKNISTFRNSTVADSKNDSTKSSGQQDEFALIDRYFKKHIPDLSNVVAGIGDDAAVVQVASGKYLVVSTDSLVADVHFSSDANPDDIGYKALAVTISDLAAMGAVASYATLNLSIPKRNDNWLKKFSEGFFELASEYNISLIGGDTVCGPLSISVTAFGVVEEEGWTSRAGAVPGDNIFVTGTLGDAALALYGQRVDLSLSKEQDVYLQQRLNRPVPRIQAGRVLGTIASSMIDLSDGLLADLSHILQASNVGADIEIERIPISSAYRQVVSSVGYEFAISYGDDYELCFTAPENSNVNWKNQPEIGSLPITCIGKIRENEGLILIDGSGNRIEPSRLGYSHF